MKQKTFVYLIIAHKNASQIKRLIDRLKGKNTAFVLHLDIRCEIRSFIDIIGDIHDEIYYVEDRVLTKWTSYGIVQATLNGLKLISKKILNVERVTLLSGQDYPIKNLALINSFFRSNRQAIYIDFNRIPHLGWKNGGIQRYPNFEMVNSVIKIYGGSQWWSFPMRLVDYILEFLDDNPAFIKYFQSVLIPDESFFQTLILNLEEKFIKKNIVNNSLRLIKWDAVYPDTNPRGLTIGDLELIKNSQELFARKFEPTTGDKNILDFIDKEILFYENEKTIIPAVANAVLFLTNKDDQRIFEEFSKIKDAQNDPHTAKIIYHKTSENIPLGIEKDIFIIDNSILHSLGYKPIKSNLLPGSNHFALMSFYREFPNYDFYWYIEDDVRYNGKWENFFDVFKNNLISDFISSHVRFYAFNRNWYWWNTLKFKEQTDHGLSMVSSFNPIFRISKKALAYLDNAMTNGWEGHHEVLIPTLLTNAGFVVNDFGGNGPFVLRDFAEKFYKGNLGEKGKELSSMRFRPFIDEKEIIAPFIYHPVKIEGLNNDWQKHLNENTV